MCTFRSQSDPAVFAVGPSEVPHTTIDEDSNLLGRYTMSCLLLKRRFERS
jgi:hypothetical protein